MWSLKENSIQKAIAFQILFNFKNNIRDINLLTSSYNKYIIDHLRELVKTENQAGYILNLASENDIKNIELSYLMNISQVINESAIQSAFNNIDFLSRVKEDGLVVAAIFYLANKTDDITKLDTLFKVITDNWDAYSTEEKLYENPFGDDFNSIADGLIERAKSSNLNKKWLYILSAKALLGKEGQKQIEEIVSEIYHQIDDKNYKKFYKQILIYI